MTGGDDTESDGSIDLSCGEILQLAPVVEEAFGSGFLHPDYKQKQHSDVDRQVISVRSAEDLQQTVPRLTPSSRCEDDHAHGFVPILDGPLEVQQEISHREGDAAKLDLCNNDPLPCEHFRSHELVLPFHCDLLDFDDFAAVEKRNQKGPQHCLKGILPEKSEEPISCDLGQQRSYCSVWDELLEAQPPTSTSRDPKVLSELRGNVAGVDFSDEVPQSAIEDQWQAVLSSALENFSCSSDIDSSGLGVLAHWYLPREPDANLRECADHDIALDEVFHVTRGQMTFASETHLVADPARHTEEKLLEDFLLCVEGKLPETLASCHTSAELQIREVPEEDGLTATDLKSSKELARKSLNGSAKAQPQAMEEPSSHVRGKDQHPEACSGTENEDLLCGENVMRNQGPPDYDCVFIHGSHDHSVDAKLLLPAHANAESDAGHGDPSSPFLDNDGFRVPSLPTISYSKETLEKSCDAFQTGLPNSPLRRKDSPNALNRRSHQSTNKRRQLFCSIDEPADLSQKVKSTFMAKIAETPKCPVTPLQNKMKARNLRRSSPAADLLPASNGTKREESAPTAAEENQGTQQYLQGAKPVIQMQPFSIIKPSEALGQITLETINRRIRSGADGDSQPQRTLPSLSRDGLWYDAWSFRTAPEGKTKSLGTVNVYRRRHSLPE